MGKTKTKTCQPSKRCAKKKRKKFHKLNTDTFQIIDPITGVCDEGESAIVYIKSDKLHTWWGEWFVRRADFWEGFYTHRQSGLEHAKSPGVVFKIRPNKSNKPTKTLWILQLHSLHATNLGKQRWNPFDKVNFMRKSNKMKF